MMASILPLRGPKSTDALVTVTTPKHPILLSKYHCPGGEKKRVREKEKRPGKRAAPSGGRGGKEGRGGGRRMEHTKRKQKLT